MAEIGLIVHQGRPEAATAARELSCWLTAGGHRVRMPPAEAAAVGSGEGVDPACFVEGLDAVVTLGGDGSILRAVELVGEAGVPILGVNFGRMGYITEVAPEDAHSAIDRLLAGEHSIEERMLLVVEHTCSHPRPSGAPSGDGRRHGGPLPGATSRPSAAPRRYVALNEAVLERPAATNALRLAVEIDDHPFTSYAADGLIVATPTGSTAYSLSARGPIIDPTHRALLLTPVSPHMLFDRSMVIAAGSKLRLEVRDDRGALLSVDGRRIADLHEHDVVACTASPHPARLVTFGGRRFHQVLKAKFGLNDR